MLGDKRKKSRTVVPDVFLLKAVLNERLVGTLLPKHHCHCSGRKLTSIPESRKFS